MKWRAYLLAVLTMLIIATPASAGPVKRFLLRVAMYPAVIVTTVCLAPALVAGAILDKLEERYLQDLYNDEARKRYALRRR